MYAILVAIHVIISIFLIAVILLQAGKGGGLADTFGGSQVQNLFGTKSNSVLTKLTSICAIGFIVTCLSLAVISSHRAKSILDTVKVPQAVKPVKTKPAEAKAPAETKTPEKAPAAAAAPVTQPQESPQGGADAVK